MTPEELERIAELAGLSLDPAELADVAAQLRAVLAQAEALDEVAGAEDEPDVEPPTPLRPDTAGPDPLTRPLPAVAPAWADGFFTVPRLPSHDNGGGGG